MYYIIFEGINGKTIGKYITKTKVVSINRKKASITRILIRSIIRIFLIEVFSFFSKRPIGWHDSISGTYVIEN